MDLSVNESVYLVLLAEWSHPFSSRTRQLSTPALMILGPLWPGKVGQCRGYEKTVQIGRFFCIDILKFLCYYHLLCQDTPGMHDNLLYL